MVDILLAVLVVVLVGAVLGAVLVVASHFMALPENETEKAVRNALPGVNCGACGYTGCDGYAKALAEGTETKTNLCVPGSDDAAKQIAEALGVEAADVVEKVAFVQCLGDCNKCGDKCEYEGIQSCAAASQFFAGESQCPNGCLGYGDCAVVCPVDAICIENGIAHVDTRKCIGCGMCEKTCPKRLITLFSDIEKVAVTCSNHEKGAVVRKECSNGCIACGKCEKACPLGAIKVVNNLATIDYSICEGCGVCVDVCPVGCIKKANFKGKFNQ